MAPTEIRHESKTKLPNAALHVIRAKGYPATRIEDICEAFILAKAKHNREVAAASIDQLRRYLELLFNQRSGTALQ